MYVFARIIISSAGGRYTIANVHACLNVGHAQKLCNRRFSPVHRSSPVQSSPVQRLYTALSMNGIEVSFSIIYSITTRSWGKGWKLIIGTLTYLKLNNGHLSLFTPSDHTCYIRLQQPDTIDEQTVVLQIHIQRPS